MNDAANAQKETSIASRFAWRLAAPAVLVVLVFAAADQWGNAVGATVGFSALLWMSRRFLKTLKQSSLRSERLSGVLVRAAINAITGGIIIFVGELIGSTFITFVSMAFGTMLIGTAVLLAALSRRAGKSQGG